MAPALDTLTAAASARHPHGGQSARTHQPTLRALPVLLLLTLLPVLLGSLAACSQRNDLLTLHGATMGTTWSVQLPHTHSRAPSLHQDITQLLAGLEAELSHWRPDSDLSGFNQAPGGSWHVLPDDLATVMAAALDLAADSQGAFDPALGALVNLWGFGPAGARDSPPSPTEMAAAQADSGWQRLRYEPGTQRLFQPGGVLLDLSAIAKGHAVDRVAGLLDDGGVRDYLVEIGGELRGRGQGPQGRPWRVAIRAPLPGQEPAAVVELAGHKAGASGHLAIATSGSYHSGFEHAGRQYSHSLDPRTGAPVAAGVLSVTVLANSAMQADALATAITVLGPEQGIAFADQRGLAVLLLVVAEGSVGSDADPGTHSGVGAGGHTGSLSADQPPPGWRLLPSAAWPAPLNQSSGQSPSRSPAQSSGQPSGQPSGRS